MPAFVTINSPKVKDYRYRCGCQDPTAVQRQRRSGQRDLCVYACSGQRRFELSGLAGYGLGFWVVFTIIVSLTLTLTLRLNHNPRIYRNLTLAG